jgi:hypothetical protein
LLHGPTDLLVQIGIQLNDKVQVEKMLVKLYQVHTFEI